MKMRFAALTLSACVLFAFRSMPLQAQTTGTSGSSGGSSSSAGGSSLGGSSGGGGGGSASAVGSGTSGFATSASTQAITAGSGASATGIPSSANPFANTYVTPQSLGLPSLYANTFGQLQKVTGTFGKGLYLPNASTTASSGAASTTTNAGTGFNTAPTPRAPLYVTVLGDDIPFKTHASSDLYANLKAAIDRSTFVKSKDTIEVQVAAGTVILRGQVGSDRERRMVEGMMRLTPGVQNVQNELQIPGIAKN